jgi:hypothetical protein
VGFASGSTRSLGGHSYGATRQRFPRYCRYALAPGPRRPSNDVGQVSRGRGSHWSRISRDSRPQPMALWGGRRRLGRPDHPAPTSTSTAHGSVIPPWTPSYGAVSRVRDVPTIRAFRVTPPAGHAAVGRDATVVTDDDAGSRNGVGEAFDHRRVDRVAQLLRIAVAVVVAATARTRAAGRPRRDDRRTPAQATSVRPHLFSRGELARGFGPCRSSKT